MNDDVMYLIFNNVHNDIKPKHKVQKKLIFT